MLEHITVPKGHRNIRILYEQELDGGGTSFGQEYIRVIQDRYPNQTFNRCYEWCSGPGFIGYALLDHNICNHICLSDIYPPAIEYANLTAKENNVTDVVTTYLIDDIALLPEEEKFDLIVANPPHYQSISNLAGYVDQHQHRKAVDKDWQAHKNFFEHIADHLTPNGIILLQENRDGSSIESFRSFINDAGLEVTGEFNSTNWFYDLTSDLKLQIYYIEIKRKL